MAQIWVPKEDITVRPPGWNEEGTDINTIYGGDISPMELAKLAQEGYSFDFLSDPEEDIYSLSDGESIDRSRNNKC